MSRVTRDYPRQADEDYATPDWVGGVIALWLKDQGVRSILEPAPGNGQLAASLRSRGFEVHAPRYDFLASTPPLRGVDALVTNPPYGERGELAEAFIRHAIELDPPIAAFLLRVDFDSAKTRVNMFRDCRPSPARSRSSTASCGLKTRGPSRARITPGSSGTATGETMAACPGSPTG